ncbi:MAG: flagellar biosynthetic protein FliO [Myxococcaceae bacterium]|nr:flagellar biosynthetic protein FliO [Myxococcaceae bacterium]
MNTLAPRQKLIALGIATGLLTLGAAAASGSFTSAARIVLGTGAIAGLVAWAIRQKGLALPSRFARTPRLQVVQKIGLSPRTGVALIEVDGRSFLIVHGDGAPRIRRVSSRAAVMAQALKEESS